MVGCNMPVVDQVQNVPEAPGDTICSVVHLALLSSATVGQPVISS
jgi:hypothetical protein